jgi:hypothetical protein
MSPICSNANPEFPIRSPAAPRGTVYGIAVLLVGATLVPYLNSFTAPFLFDDLKWIVNDPQVRDISSDWRRLDLGQRPVVFLSLAINYALGHLDVRGYHLFNFAVHAVAGLALFGIIRRTIDLRNGRSGRDLPAVSLAFTIALVWLVHPLQTQSVTYVIQRCESLMGMFFLLCLYCVIRGAQATRGWPWYSAALVACLLGLGCKEVMATAPAVILLYDRAFLSPSWRDAARRRGLLYVLLFGAALMLAAAMRSTILETEGSAADCSCIESATSCRLASSGLLPVAIAAGRLHPRPLAGPPRYPCSLTERSPAAAPRLQKPVCGRPASTCGRRKHR